VPSAPALPLTVIAGYLGAGKTTLVNHLLATSGGRRILVMVNDFGDIAIDAELIATQDGEAIVLSNGCVCCSMGSDLFRTFSKALNMMPRPDHLVVEASGVAEPNRIANIARAEPDLSFDAIITLVDAQNARKHLGDPLIASTLRAQIQSADLLLLTKTDLADLKDTPLLESDLKRLNKAAPLLCCGVGSVPSDILIGPKAEYKHQASDSEPTPDHEELYSRWSFSSDATPEEAVLQKLLQGLPPGILRLKGISTDKHRSRSFIFHLAGQQIHTSSAEPRENAVPGIRAVAIGLGGKLPVAALEAAFGGIG